MQKIEMVGMRYGLLTVIAESKERKGRDVQWICQCDCGNTTPPITAGNLRKGHTKSCGCLRTKHGDYKTRLYGVWHGMKKRCYSASDHAFANYGGRGISVCDAWKESFPAFREWAVANGYNESAKRGECTLDRIDVNGNYCPENCRWVTMKVQQNNRRNNVDRKRYSDADSSCYG